MVSSDLAGRVEGKTFVMPVRVYYEDTDAGGVVYYANYFKFAERARSEMLRHLGLENSAIQDEYSLAIVVRKVSAQYHRPAKLDDLLNVELNLTDIQGARIEGEQRIYRGDELLVTIYIQLACMKLTGGPGRLPQNVRNLLQTFVTPQERGNENE